MAIAVANLRVFPGRVDIAGGAVTRGLTKSNVTVTGFASSYPAGGEAITATQVGLPGGIIQSGYAHQITDGPRARLFTDNDSWVSPTPVSVKRVVFDPATSKLRAYNTAGEVATGTDLSALLVHMEFFGTPAAA
jgi:hypothetical protein